MIGRALALLFMPLIVVWVAALYVGPGWEGWLEDAVIRRRDRGRTVRS